MRQFCVASLLVFLLTTMSVAADRPNVLMILVDDLKPSLGAYGDDFVHSPNLDALASSGMRFDAAYCNQAVCAPSRNNLLVGQRSTTLGVYSLGFHFRRALPSAVTLPQHFKNHGYHSAGVGKVFHVGHGNINDEASWSVPFQPDKVIDYCLEESTGGQLTREEAYFSNQKLGQNKSLPRGAAWEKADVGDDAYADGRIAREGIRRLKDYSASKQPFFLALGFTKPHLPFCAPTKYWDIYDPDALPIAELTVPPIGAPKYAGKTLGELNQYKPVPQNPPLPPEMHRTLVHGYYAALSYMDAQVGLVLKELEQLGLAENTIVVLWGDHGYHLGDHGSWTKHTNYEQANRIPIIIRAPGKTVGSSSCSQVIETVDIYPTLCELAGLPDPVQSLDGESLVPVLAGKGKLDDNYAYHCFPKANRLGEAIRTERYRLVRWTPKPKVNGPKNAWQNNVSSDRVEWELYDYQTDPLETKNLYEDLPGVAAELTEILEQQPAPKFKQ